MLDRLPDPMREIDLLVLESMLRRRMQTRRTTRMAQAFCLTAVAVFFFAAFFYALTYPDQTGRSGVPVRAEIGVLPDDPGAGPER